MTETIVSLNTRSWGRLLQRYSNSIIGREPEILIDSPNRTVVKYDPALTPTEKTQLNTNLPQWVRWLFDLKLIDGE